MSKAKKDWQILSETYLERFKIFSVKKSKRVNPRSGAEFEFLLMEGLNWADIIPITADGEIVLIKQFRHGTNSVTIEVPGGCVEAGEDPKLCAARELSEETGYVSDQIEHLGTIDANPAMQSMKLHVYLAKNAAKRSQPNLDPGEDIETLVVPLKKAFDMIKSGEISHALIVAALGLYALKYGVPSS